MQIHLSHHENGFVLYFCLHLLAHSITKQRQHTILEIVCVCVCVGGGGGIDDGVCISAHMLGV